MSEILTISEQKEKYGSQRLRRISVLNRYSDGMKHHKSYNNGFVTYTYTKVDLVVYADKDFYISPTCKNKIQEILAILHNDVCDYETDILYEYSEYSSPYDYNSYFSDLVCKIINRFSNYYYAIPTYFVRCESQALWNGQPKSLETLISPTAVEIVPWFVKNKIYETIKLSNRNTNSYPPNENVETLLSIKQQREQDDIAEFKITRDLEWNNEDESIRFDFIMKGKCTFIKFMQWCFGKRGSEGKEGVIWIYEYEGDFIERINLNILIYNWEIDFDRCPEFLNDRIIEKAELIKEKNGQVIYKIFLKEVKQRYRFDYL